MNATEMTGHLSIDKACLKLSAIFTIYVTQTI